MSLNEKFDQVKQQGREILDTLKRQLEKIKKKNLNKVVKEIRKHKNDWEVEFNRKMVTKPELVKFKLRLPELETLQQYLKKNLADVPKNLTQNTNRMKTPEMSEISEMSEDNDKREDSGHLELSNNSSENEAPVDMEELEGFYKKTLNKHELSLTEDSLRFLISKVLRNQKKKLTCKYKISKKKNKFEAVKFQKYSENIENLLVLCVSAEGEEFGGLARTGWNNEDKDFSRNFIFSLSKKSLHRQMKAMSETFSLHYLEEKGPCFGTDDLVIGDNPQLDANSTSNLGNHFEFKGANPREYLAGSENFKLIECLIYEIKEF